MGCGVHAPNVMTKLKKDNDLAYLIQASKVSYPKGCKDAWYNYNWLRSSTRKEREKEINFIVDYHETKMIHC
jgi:hypothetical protein